MYLYKYELVTLLIILDFTINSHNIKKHIFSASNSIISGITNDVRNKLISLKIDCVKRHFRSIMGVNIQYIKYGKVCLATLAMREVNEQHTSENLKKLVFILLKFCTRHEFNHFDLDI